MAFARVLLRLGVCACIVVFCSASPARRQFADDSGTTSPEPVGMKEGEIWNNDDFVLDGDEDWLGASSPPPRDYEGGDPEEGDEEYRDGEDEEGREFLFIPSKDSRLMLQDDREDSGPIKVRHTSKGSYSESLDSGGNSAESSRGLVDKDSGDDQFEFTMDDKDDDSDDDKQVDDDSDDDTDDFVLEDSPQNSLADDDTPDKDSEDSVSNVPRRQLQEDDDDSDDDDDNFVSDDDDPMFDSPEEDSQVIYGDHVFLY